MFYSLTGKLVHMEPGVVAIECGGVAFKCFTSMNTQKNMPHRRNGYGLYAFKRARGRA